MSDTLVFIPAWNEEGNLPALAAYRRLAFREVGRRSGYYALPDGSRAAALTMSVSL